MTRFVIDLGDIEMSDRDQEKLNSDLQQVALSYVSGLRIDKPLAVKFPYPFPWGIIIGPDFARVLEVEKVLGKALGK